jgi:predicted helicase
MFPSPSHTNIVICTSGVGARRPFSALVTDTVPGRDMQDTGQCFPLYIYDPPAGSRMIQMGVEVVDGYERHPGVTDPTLTSFQAHYGAGVTKEDVFYYVYGVLHSPAYRAAYGADLKKMLPRIPMAEDFTAFSAAGRELASLHLSYESVGPFPLEGMPSGGAVSANQLSVVEMKFAKRGASEDRSRIVFNSHTTLEGIPEDAYRYQVDGKSAIEWVMARYRVTKDKDSGIVSDPNTWSSNPRYVVELVGRVVTVSLETMKIVDGLPGLAG